MLKRIGFVVGSCFLLAGCGSGSVAVPGSNVPAAGSIYKSVDSGKTFVPKVTVNDTLRISSADVLSWVFQPGNAQTIYIGTLKDGIFRTKDGTEHWEKLKYPPEKVYGMAIDASNPNRIFATGVYAKVGKIYRTEDSGENWKEVYVEPGPGTVITSLSMSSSDSRVLYAATDTGGVIKSIDGGESWKNVYQASGPVLRIILGSKNPESVVLLIFQKGVVSSMDGGLTWGDTSQSIVSASSDEKGKNVKLEDPVALVADPHAPNVLYAGTVKGLFRSSDFGKTWQEITIIESAKQYPIHALAINPENANEITFVSGSVLYRSTDGGSRWAVTNLGIERGVNVVMYEPGNSAILYFGLRKF